MPFINTNEQTPELSLEEKQAKSKAELAELITGTFRSLKTAHVIGKSILDQNRYGLTREQVIAGLGDDAPEFAALTALLINVLNTAVPGTVPTPEQE